MKNHQETFLYILKGVGILILFLFASYGLRVLQGFSFSSIEPFSKQNLEVVVAGKTKQLPLSQVLTVVHKPEVESAGFFKGFLYWTGILHNTNTPVEVNSTVLETYLTQWERELEFEQVVEGSIEIKNETLQIQNPKNGNAIDTKHITRSLYTLARKKDIRRNYTLYTRRILEKPATDIASFENTVQVLSFGINNDIHLSNKEFSIDHTLKKSDMTHLLFADKNPATHRFSPAVDTELLAELLAKYNRESKDAQFMVRDNYYVDIEPSQVGILVDIPQSSETILQALRQEKISAELVLSDPISPNFTTRDAEGLNITHLVSSFTTYYSCCEARARNIQKFADLVNNTVVAPGQEFNLNTFAGRRTSEDGFEPAGTLIKGSLIETVGGGVSQFATTFFNAVYWGGYKDIAHKPHSRYFSRYPEGIEATISWPEPHLIFQNDSESGIWIRATHTPQSVTVAFFGNNDGRILTGSHKDGQTSITIPAEGGNQARVVVSEVGEREILHEPKEVYFTNELIPPGVVVPKSEGRPNYSVEVVRTLLQNGEQISQNKKTVRYLSEDKEFFVHSCEFAPPFTICKTPEDLEKEKEALEEFFTQLEANF